MTGKNGKHLDKRTSRTPPRIRGRPSENWRERFLDGLRSSFHVEYALRIAQVSKDTAYKARRNEPAFRLQWDEAREQGLDRLRPQLEESIIYKAIHGWQEPVFHAGKIRGHKTVFSVPLMTWAAERLMRERYYVTPQFAAPPPDAQQFAALVHALIAGAKQTVEPPTITAVSDAG